MWMVVCCVYANTSNKWRLSFFSLFGFFAQTPSTWRSLVAFFSGLLRLCKHHHHRQYFLPIQLSPHCPCAFFIRKNCHMVQMAASLKAAATEPRTQHFHAYCFEKVFPPHTRNIRWFLRLTAGLL